MYDPVWQDLANIDIMQSRSHYFYEEICNVQSMVSHSKCCGRQRVLLCASA